MTNEDAFAALKNSIRQEVLAEVIDSINKMTGAAFSPSPKAVVTKPAQATKQPAKIKTVSFDHTNGTAMPKRRGRPRKNPEQASAN